MAKATDGPRAGTLSGRSARALRLPDHVPQFDADWPLWTTAGQFLVCFLLMTWPWVAGIVTIPWDAKAHFLPQIQFLADSLARGEWPWWNPFVFSGSPQVADPQSMIFSPPFLLLALFSRSPSLWASDMTVLATMAAGGVGLILYFRDRGWHPGGAVIAALVFSFGAAMAWRMQHTGQVLSLAYWPWALLFLERAVRRGSLFAGVLSGAIAAAIVLGRDQVALLCIYLLAGRVLWLWLEAEHCWAAIRRSLVPLTAGGIAGALLIAIPVLMTALLAAESNRPQIDFEGAGRGSLHPALLITLVLPQLFGAAGAMEDFWGPPSFAWEDTGLYTAQNVGQLYIGAVPLLAIVAGAVRGRLWEREARFFAVAFVLMLLYALGWYTPVFRVLYELPGVNLYRRPADAVFLIGALAAILAGYSIGTWFDEPWKKLGVQPAVAMTVLVGLAVLAAIIFGVRIDRLSRVPGPMLGGLVAFGAAAAVVWWCRERIALMPARAALGLAVLTAADLGWNNGPTSSSALPVAFYDVLQPDTKNPTVALLKAKVVANETRRDRVELAGLGFHWPNAAITHRLESTLGYNPVRLGDYSRATGAGDHVGLPDQRKFSKLMPSYRSLLADMLGLRWIAAGAQIETIDKAPQPGDLPLIAETPDNHFIYENPRALPRVLFTREARAATFSEIINAGSWPPFDPRETVLLESVPSGQADRRPGTARIKSYANSEVILETESPDGGFVVLNDIWHPWWFAEVDGRPVELLRANVLFRAVEVPGGRHQIRLIFRPIDGMLKRARIPGFH